MTKARIPVAAAALALLPAAATAEEAASAKIPPAVCVSEIAAPPGPPLRAGLHEVALVRAAPSCAAPRDRPVAAKALPAPRPGPAPRSAPRAAPRPAPWRADPM